MRSADRSFSPYLAALGPLKFYPVHSSPTAAFTYGIKPWFTEKCAKDLPSHVTLNVLDISLTITKLKPENSNQSFQSPEADPGALLAICKIALFVTIVKDFSFTLSIIRCKRISQR